MPVRSQSVTEWKRPSSEQESRPSKARSAHPLSTPTADSRSSLTSARASSSRLQRRLRKRSLTSAAASLADSSSANDEDALPLPKPAWEQFSEHIKTFSTMGPSYSASDPDFQKNMDSLLDGSGSNICKKILKDMKDQLERKRAKELLILQKQRESEEAARDCDIDTLSEESDDDDSDDEESEEKRLLRLKTGAHRYWDMIRRDVQERIRIRKEKNPAGGTWNALRSQLRALTRANNVRQELYEKYGIIPRPGAKVAEDSMKPTLSINIKEVVHRFQSFQVRKLKVTFA